MSAPKARVRPSEPPETSKGRLRAAVAELYATAPAGFVPRRTALAKQARSGGDRDAATQIAALRKPSAAAWALNQALRADPGLGDRLGDLGERLRHAQSTLDASGLAALRGERDAVLDALVEAAADVAERAGHPLAAPGQGEVRATGIAALADRAAQEVVLSGSLTRALSYSGFGEVDVSDAVARTSTGVILSRLEGGATKRSDAATEAVADDEARVVGAAGVAEEAGVAAEVAQAAEEDRRARRAAQVDQARTALQAADRELAARSVQLEQARTRSESTRARVERLRAELARAQEEDEAALEAVGTAVAARRQAEADRDRAAAAVEAVTSG